MSEESAMALVNGSDQNYSKESKEWLMSPYYKMVFLEYSIMAEFLLLQKQALPGVYVVPSEKSSLVWNGVVFVRQGIYQGGVFKFKVIISSEFPDGDTSSVVFTPPVFHPLVDPNTGRLDVGRDFHPWKKKVHHLWQLVALTKRIFTNIEFVDPLNSEAAQMFQKDAESFKSRVQKSILRGSDQLFASTSSDFMDLHALRFSSLNEEMNASIKKDINIFKRTKNITASSTKNDIRNLGPSWMFNKS